MRSWEDYTHAERAIFLSHFNQKCGIDEPLRPKPYVDHSIGDYLIQFVNENCDKARMAEIRADMDEREAIREEAETAKAEKDRWELL